MARGNFRTPKDMCLYCGARRNDNTRIYKRGLNKQPDYLCEKCFDMNATAKEKEEKDSRLVNQN